VGALGAAVIAAAVLWLSVNGNGGVFDPLWLAWVGLAALLGSAIGVLLARLIGWRNRWIGALVCGLVFAAGWWAFHGWRLSNLRMKGL
jgi:uncharacterized membrane protein YfcA